MYRDGIADLMLEPQEVDEEYIASAKALLISGTALAQSPSREAALKAVLIAKKTDTRVIFDIDYRLPPLQLEVRGRHLRLLHRRCGKSGHYNGFA